MKLSAAEIDSLLLAEQGAAPTTPASGYGRLYIKSDGLYFVNDAGAETGPLGAASGAASFVGAKATKSAVQSISTGTWTAVTFPAEAFDTSAIHDTASNTSRLTVPGGMGGYWRFGATVGFESVGDAKLVGIEFYLGGVATGRRSVIYTGAGTAYPVLHLTDVMSLSVGNYVEVYARQDNGSNRDVSATSVFWAEYLGA